MADVKVEQVDRDAAAGYLASIVPTMPLLSEKVRSEQTALAQAFARHRLAALATGRDDKLSTDERNAVIEECAKVADAMATRRFTHDMKLLLQLCADRIRALKDASLMRRLFVTRHDGTPAYLNAKPRTLAPVPMSEWRKRHHVNQEPAE